MKTAMTVLDLLDETKDASWSTNYRHMAQAALAAAANSSRHEVKMEFVSLAQVYSNFALIQALEQEGRWMRDEIRGHDA